MFAPFVHNSVSDYAITSAMELDLAGYLSRMFGAGTQTRFFMSCWVLKVSQGSGSGVPLLAESTSNDKFGFGIAAFDDCYFINNSQTTPTIRREPNGKFRDPQWMHVALDYDSANTNIDIYINGELRPYDSSVGPSLNQTTRFNSAVEHYIGYAAAGSAYSKALIAEYQFFNNKSIANGDLTINQFCEINNGRPEPVKPNFTAADYGATNGCYLKFENGALGTDSSGNGNNWTVNGTITAVTNTPTDVGAVYQVLDAPTNKPNCSDGNRTARSAGTLNRTYPAKSTLSFDVEDTDGYYMRVYILDGVTTGSNFNAVGIIPQDDPFDADVGFPSNTGIYYREAGNVTENGSTLQTYATYGPPDYINIAVKNGSLWFGKNGVWNGDPVAGTGAAKTGLTGQWQLYSLMYLSSGGTDAAQTYDSSDDTDMPTGFKLLTVANLPPVTGQLSDRFVEVQDTEANIESTLAAARSGWSNYLDVYKNEDTDERWLFRFSHDGSNEHRLGDGGGGSGASNDIYGATSSLSGTDQWYAKSVRLDIAYGMSGGSAAHTSGSATTVTHNVGIDRQVILLFPRAGGEVYMHHPDFGAGNLLVLTGSHTIAASTIITNITSNSFDIGSGVSTGTYDYFVMGEDDFNKIASYEGNANTGGHFVNVQGDLKAYHIKNFDAAEAPRYRSRLWDKTNPMQGEAYPSLDNAVVTVAHPLDNLGLGIKPNTTDASLNGSGQSHYVWGWCQPIGGGANPRQPRGR